MNLSEVGTRFFLLVVLSLFALFRHPLPTALRLKHVCMVVHIYCLWVIPTLLEAPPPSPLSFTPPI